MRKFEVIVFTVLLTCIICSLWLIWTARANAVSYDVTATVPPHDKPTLVGKVKFNYGSQLETWNPQQ